MNGVQRTKIQLTRRKIGRDLLTERETESEQTCEHVRGCVQDKIR